MTSHIKIFQILWLKSKDNPSQIVRTKFYASSIKNKIVRREDVICLLRSSKFLKDHVR